MSQSSPENKPNLEQAGASDESILKVHAILERENAEPSENYKPLPLFLLGFIAAMVCISALYFVRYRGDFNPLVYDERYDPSQVVAAAAAAPVGLTHEQVLAEGKKLFNTCATCHQATGLGIPKVYPPLAGSEWVQGEDTRVVQILLHGLMGRLEVHGEVFNGSMPPFGEAGYKWSDDKISYVLTYVRQEWGNKADPISPARVAEIRKAISRSTPWSEAELKALEPVPVSESAKSAPQQGASAQSSVDIAAGKKLFATCATCHQATGLGIPKVYPPLAGSEWAQGEDKKVVQILIHGLSGPLEVHGQTFNGAMPPFGEAGYKWSDEKISNVLSYVRQEWGNKADPITAERVKEIRESIQRDKPWTEAELKALD